MLIFGGSIGIAKETNEILFYQLEHSKFFTIFHETENNSQYASPRSLGKIIRGDISSKNSSTPFSGKNLIEEPSFERNKFPNDSSKATYKTFNIALNLMKTKRTFLKSKSPKTTRITKQEIKNRIKKRNKNTSEKIKLPVTPTFSSMKSTLIYNIKCNKVQKDDKNSSMMFKTWSDLHSGKVSCSIPAPRDGHVALNIGNNMIVFGGEASNGFQ